MKRWRRQRTPSRTELIHVDFVNDKRGWIVGEGGTILTQLMPARPGGDRIPERSPPSITLIFGMIKRVGLSVSAELFCERLMVGNPGAL